MKTSTIWKGLSIVVVLFLFTALEASAQLPVRTQQLQLIDPAAIGGVITQDAPSGAVTSYTVSWPGSAAAFLADGDEAILIGTRTAANDIDMRWELSDGFVDGNGAVGHVTIWEPDDNTLEFHETFEYDNSTGQLSIGLDGVASGLGAETYYDAGTAGSIQVGDGTNAQVTINSVGGEIRAGVNTAGSIQVTDANNLNNIDLDGASATATLGQADATNAAAGVIEIFDGGAGAAGNSVTVQTGAQTSDWTLQPNDHTAGDATYWIRCSKHQRNCH